MPAVTKMKNGASRSTTNGKNFSASSTKVCEPELANSVWNEKTTCSHMRSDSVLQAAHPLCSALSGTQIIGHLQVPDACPQG